MEPENNSSDENERLAGLALERFERKSEPGEAGGEPCLTPLSISKCAGAEDWLELSLYLQHNDFSRLKKWLDAAREASEANLRGPDELEIAGRKFLMLPSAALAGSEKKQVVYRWRLRSEDGWWLLLMNRANSHETLPTGIARASSLPLMRIGANEFCGNSTNRSTI